VASAKAPGSIRLWIFLVGATGPTSHSINSAHTIEPSRVRLNFRCETEAEYWCAAIVLEASFGGCCPSAGTPPVERTQQARTREEYQPARRLRDELKPQHTDRSCGRVAAPARREPVDWRREGAAFTGWVAACRRVQRISFDSEDLASAREVNTLGTAFAPSDHRSQHPALGRSRRNRIVRRVAASFRAPAGANRGRQ
jgi:hypothetical protein